MLLGKNKGDSGLLDEPIFYDGIGANLRAARERQALTIADLAAHLMIQARYLNAIEAGEFENLPGPAYAVGFVQSYANILGLDGAQAVALFKEETSGKLSISELDFPQPLDESRRTSPIFIILILLVAVGGYGGWVYLKRSGLLDAPLPIIEVPKGSIKKQNLPEKSTLLKKHPMEVVSNKSVAEISTNTDLAVHQKFPNAGATDRVASNKIAPVAKSQETENQNIDILKTGATQTLNSTKTAGTSVRSNAQAVTPAKDTPKSVTAKIPPEKQLAANSAVALKGKTKRPSIAISNSKSAALVLATNTEAPNPVGRVKKSISVLATGNSVPKKQANRTVEFASQPSINTAGKSIAVDEVSKAASTETQQKLDQSAEPIVTAARTAKDKSTTVGSFEKLSDPDPAKIPAPKLAKSTSTETKTAPIVTAPAAKIVNGRTPQIFGATNKNARVILIAHRDAWIQVKSRRNELLLTRMLYPGDQYHAPNRRDIFLTVGNAGAIEIRVDGEAINSLGDIGVVRRNIPLSADKLRKLLP